MKPQKNFWPLGIVLTFVVFTGGCIAMIVIACTHKTDLITSDYYRDEIRFQSRLDQLNRTAQLGGRVDVDYDVGNKSINVTVPAPAGVTGSIQLYRPSATGLDQVVPLQLDANGSQSLDAAHLLPGLWKVRVQWSSQNQEYFADKSIVVKRGA